MLLVGLSAAHAVDRRPAINLAWEWGAVGLAYLLVRNLPRTRGESAALAGAWSRRRWPSRSTGSTRSPSSCPLMRARYLSHRARVAPDGRDRARARRRRRSSSSGCSPRTSRGRPSRWPTRWPASWSARSSLALAVGWENLRRPRGRGAARLGALALARRPGPGHAGLPDPDQEPERLPRPGSSALAVLAWRERRRVRPRTLALAGVGGAGRRRRRWWPRGWRRASSTARSSPSRPSRCGIRWEYWVGAWRVINESPRAFWSGSGRGTSPRPYLRHKLPEASEEIHDPHNLVLEVWATAGRLGRARPVWRRSGWRSGTCSARPRAPPTGATSRPTRPCPRDEPGAPPRRSGWLLACAGGGWLAGARRWAAQPRSRATSSSAG